MMRETFVLTTNEILTVIGSMVIIIIVYFISLRIKNRYYEKREEE